MEKIIYILWRNPATDIAIFSKTLREELAPQLKKLGARHLKLNLFDHSVQPAAKLRQTHTQPPVEVLAQVWVDSAIAHLRKPVDQAIGACTQQYAAYLVTESQPLVNLKHPARAGIRTEGFAQIALLKKPPALDYATWLDIWHNSHTDIAIRTQSTFEYIQNVVVRALTPGAPHFDAIVEESFPASAMTDFQAFFDAPGDEVKFRKNLEVMMQSVGRFIEPGKLDVTPSSQYLMF